MRSAANSDVKMAKAPPVAWVPDTSRPTRFEIYSLNHAETKSKPACLHRRGAREKSGILKINTPIFFNSSARTGLTEQTYGEKSWGHRPFWDFFFKKPLFPIAIHTKTGMLFGQHFDGELRWVRDCFRGTLLRTGACLSRTSWNFCDHSSHMRSTSSSFEKFCNFLFSRSVQKASMSIPEKLRKCTRGRWALSMSMSDSVSASCRSNQEVRANKFMEAQLVLISRAWLMLLQYSQTCTLAIFGHVPSCESGLCCLL